MFDVCPLLIRASFIGQTYHDFQLKFESPAKNCSIPTNSSPLLVQFTRVLNETFNETSYSLYNPFDGEDQSLHLQVFHRDRVDLCIGSVFEADESVKNCHEFHMVTMLTSRENPFWPMVLISIYILILLICILFSSLRQRVRQSLQCFRRQRASSKDKRLFCKSINAIAKDCRQVSHSSVYSVSTRHQHENFGYNSNENKC